MGQCAAPAQHLEQKEIAVLALDHRALLFDSFTQGHHQIGKIRLLKFGDLLGAEAAEIQNQQAALTQAALQLMALATRISQAEGIEYETVLQQLQQGAAITPELFGKFADEAALMLASMPSQTAADDAVLTVALQLRGEIEGPDGWAPLEDWTLADTRRLPSRFRAQIRSFLDVEAQGDEAPTAPHKTTKKAAA